jgi:hypothetical protein
MARKPIPNDLPCLDLLEATPEILRSLLIGVSDDDARAKPAPDRFSIAEVLAHLSHTEGHCHRTRLDRLIAEDRPTVPDDDASMHYDLYRNRDPEEEFAHFEEQRETNIEFLRNLPPGSGARRGVHAELGEFTLAEMLHEWARHDLGHIRQIAGIVQEQLGSGSGPWAKGSE